MGGPYGGRGLEVQTQHGVAEPDGPVPTRLNGAVTKGFEDDVGTKTSFYGFTVNTMKNSLISYRKLGFTSVPQGQVRPLGVPPFLGLPPGGEPQGTQCGESLCQELGCRDGAVASGSTCTTLGVKG